MSLLSENRELLGQFRAGDRHAMELVYRHYAPQLSSLVASGLHTRTSKVRPAGPYEVGSVVQEVFARAFADKARLAYDGASPYLQYLTAIARNYLLNQLRDREDAADAELIEAALARSAGGGVAVSQTMRSPEEIAEQREVDALVEKFLSSRPVREQAVFRARFEQGLTQIEAASALGLTRIQVRRSEAHLRRGLYAALKSTGYLDRVPFRESSLLPIAAGSEKLG